MRNELTNMERELSKKLSNADIGSALHNELKSVIDEVKRTKSELEQKLSGVSTALNSTELQKNFDEFIYFKPDIHLFIKN